MSKKTETYSKDIYVCDVCGYDSDFRQYYDNHVKNHRGQTSPFKVGDRVGYIQEEIETDWGHDYRVGRYYEGTIIKFIEDDNDNGRYVLVEHDNETRHTVGEWELGLPRPPEVEDWDQEDKGEPTTGPYYAIDTTG